VADETTKSLEIQTITSAQELLSFLGDQNLLHNLDDFRNKFLVRLLNYLEDPDNASPFIQFKDDQVVAAEVLQYLPGLLDEEGFLSALGIPREATERLDLIRQEFDLSSVIGVKESDPQEPLSAPVLRIQRDNAFEASEKIRRFFRQLKALSGQNFTEKDPEYEAALQGIIAQKQSKFDEKKAKLLDAISPAVASVPLDEKIRSQLENRWQSLEPEQVKLEKEKLDEIHATQKKKLAQQLEDWKKQVLSLEDQESRQQILQIQIAQDIAGLLGKKGLLELFVLWAGKEPLKPLIDSFKEYCITLVEPFNSRRGSSPPQQAEFDVEFASEKLYHALESIEESLRKARKILLDKAETTYRDDVSSTLLGASVAAPPSPADGGDSDDTNQEAPPSGDVALSVLVAAWQEAASAWKRAWSFIENTDDSDTKKKTLFALLTENKLQVGNLLALDFDFQSFFASLPPDKRQKSANQAQQIIELSNLFFPEDTSSPPPPPATPAPVPGQPLQTAFTNESAVDEQTDKLLTLGQISRSKAELVAFTMQQLRWKLAEQGYSQEEITAYLELYEAQISSQIWMKILEKNGLRTQIALADLVAIEKEITDQYSTFITKAFPPKDTKNKRAFPSLDEETLLRNFLASQGLDADVYLQQFSHKSLQRAMELTKEFSQLSFAQRVAIATDLLKDKVDQSTATNLARVFVALASGGNVVQYTTIFDELALQMFQKHWSQLTVADQAKISQLLSHFYENMAIFGLVFGLSELRQLQTEIAQLQELFRLMQAHKNAQGLSSPLMQSVESYAPVDPDAPTKRGWDDAVLDGEANQVSSTRNVTLQVSVLFAVEIQTEVRDNLLTLVMQRPVSMQEFGGLLEFAQTGVQPAEPIDARLLAQFQNFNQMQQENPEAFAAQEQQALQQFAQADYNRKRLQVAIKLVRAAAQAYAGNPAALVALLSDAESRKIIQNEVRKWSVRIGGAAAGGAAYTALAPLIGLVSGVTSALTTLGLIGKEAGTAATNIASVGNNLAAEALSDASVTAGAGASKELTALNKTLGELSNTLSQIPSQVSTATSTLGVGKSLAIAAFSSIFGPITLIGLLTIIVITVIGASLNDLPFGTLRTSFYDGIVCWPTNGIFVRGQESGHRTSANGSAIDIGGKINEPIYTPFSGTVSRVGWDKDGYGNYVDIETDDGFHIIFAHMADRSPLVETARVEVNTQVGVIGSTGDSEGPHLHYEIISTTLKIEDIVPSQPPMVYGSVISIDQCENFGTKPAGRLIAVTAGGGGYAYLFNDGYNIVTQADLSATKHVGVFGQEHGLEAAINGNLYTPAAGTIDGIYTNGAGNPGYSLEPRPMEIAALFLSVDSLPEETVSKLAVTSGNRVLYNQNGLVMLNIRGVGSSGDDEQVIREEILPVVEHAVSGVPPIMINGNAQDMSPYAVSDPVSTTVLRPRTIFGWSEGANGREFAFVVVRDATFWDLDNVANEVGLTYAFALDGGNSSQLYVQNHDFSDDGGWIDAGGGWHPEGGDRAVPVLIGIEPKN